MAVWAADETAQWKFRVASEMAYDPAVSPDDALHLRKLATGHHGNVFSFVFLAGPWIHKNAGVVRIPENVIDRLRAHGLTARRDDSPVRHLAQNLGLRVRAGRVFPLRRKLCVRLIAIRVFEHDGLPLHHRNRLRSITRGRSCSCRLKKSGVEYYASTISVWQERIQKSTVRLIFLGERPEWLRLYECDSSGATQLVKDLQPSDEAEQRAEYTDAANDVPAQSARIYVFFRNR